MTLLDAKEFDPEKESRKRKRLVLIITVIVIILFLQTFHFIIAEFIIKSCPKPSTRITLKELIDRNQNQQKPMA